MISRGRKRYRNDADSTEFPSPPAPAKKFRPSIPDSSPHSSAPSSSSDPPQARSKPRPRKSPREPLPLAQDEERAVAIVRETDILYKVRWEGVDPTTGQAWNDTWEPKHYCNALLTDDWKLWKSTNRSRSHREDDFLRTRRGWVPKSDPTNSDVGKPPSKSANAPPNKHARVILSSPDSEISAAKSQNSQASLVLTYNSPNTQAVQGFRGIGIQQAPDFDPLSYETGISQPLTQDSIPSAEASTQDIPGDGQIIPDSQSLLLNGSASQSVRGPTRRSRKSAKADLTDLPDFSPKSNGNLEVNSDSPARSSAGATRQTKALQQEVKPSSSQEVTQETSSGFSNKSAAVGSARSARRTAFHPYKRVPDHSNGSSKVNLDSCSDLHASNLNGQSSAVQTLKSPLKTSRPARNVLRLSVGKKSPVESPLQEAQVSQESSQNSCSSGEAAQRPLSTQDFFDAPSTFLNSEPSQPPIPETIVRSTTRKRKAGIINSSPQAFLRASAAPRTPLYSDRSSGRNSRSSGKSTGKGFSSSSSLKRSSRNLRKLLPKLQTAHVSQTSPSNLDTNALLSTPSLPSNSVRKPAKSTQRHKKNPSNSSSFSSRSRNRTESIIMPDASNPGPATRQNAKGRQQTGQIAENMPNSQNHAPTESKTEAILERMRRDKRARNAAALVASSPNERPNTSDSPNHSSDQVSVIQQTSRTPIKLMPGSAAARPPASAGQFPVTASTYESADDSTFYIPLKLSSEVRKMYQHEFDSWGPMIDSFLENETAYIEKVQNFMQLLHNIENHIDLLEPEQSEALNTEDQAAWDASISSKFGFLGAFLNVLRHSDKRIILLVKPGRNMDYVERFLRGRGISYERSGRGRYQSPESSKCFVSVIASIGTHEVLESHRPDLVIGFDETFRSTDPRISQLNRRAAVTPVSVVSVVVASSLHHAELEMAKQNDSSPLSQTRRILMWAHALRAKAGTLPHNFPRTSGEVGEQLAAAIREGTNLEQSGIMGLPSLPEMQGFSPSSSGNYTSDSDSVLGKPSLARNDSPISEREQRARKRARQDEALLMQSEHQPREGDLAMSSAGSDEAQKEIQDLKKQAEKSSREHEASLGELQFRFEDLSVALRSKETELKTATDALSNAKNRIETLNGTCTTLREERSKLKADLEKTNQVLTSSIVPELQELAALRKQAAEAEDLRKRLESQKKDQAFFTEQYQTASSRAAEYSHELTAVKAENEELKKQASGELSKARKLFMDTTVAKANSDLERCKQTLEAHEELLQRTSMEMQQLREEYRALREQQERQMGMAVVTRAGSVRASSQPREVLNMQAAVQNALAPASTRLRAFPGGSRSNSRANSRAGSPMPSGTKGGATPLQPSNLRE